VFVHFDWPKMFCISFALGPIAWFITAELVPQSHRSLTQSIALSFNQLMSLVLGFVTLPAYDLVWFYHLRIIYQLFIYSLMLMHCCHYSYCPALVVSLFCINIYLKHEIRRFMKLFDNWNKLSVLMIDSSNQTMTVISLNVIRHCSCNVQRLISKMITC